MFDYEAEQMTFRTFLKRQIERQDPVGDLARDYVDGECCLSCETVDELESHMLVSHTPSSEAVTALEQAKGEWDDIAPTPKQTREPLSYGLRFEVLHRDLFTCQMCGDRPGNQHLHVDHLLPWSRGGSNDIGNLSALCSRCNLGKRARIMIPAGQCESRDSSGFAVWKRFGAWTVEVGDDCLIINYPSREYWFDVTRAWESDWTSHIGRKTWCDHEVMTGLQGALEFAHTISRQMKPVKS